MLKSFLIKHQFIMRTTINLQDHAFRAASDYAAARAMKDQLKGKRVGILISGGNVDLARFGSLLAA